MYPIIAISTPMGMSALEYADASIGADATPPMLASEAMPIVNRSSLNSLANISINIKCIRSITNPAMMYSGACVSSVKLARDTMRAMSRYNIIFANS